MDRIRAWLHRTTVTQVALSIGWVLAATSAALALVMLLTPEQMLRVPTFRAALEFAPPHVWGIGWGILAAWIAVRLALDPPAAPAAAPLFILAVYTSVWSMLTIPAVADGTGAPSAIVAYLALAAISALSAYALEKGGDR